MPYKYFKIFTWASLEAVFLREMKISVALLTCFTLTAATPVDYGGYAAPATLIHAHGIVKPEPVAYPKYHFEYGVKDGHTGDIKEQSEERDGDVVKGEYSLVEPDGTVRKVQYHDDGHSGFNAIVTRSGHAVHPPSKITAPVVPVLSYGGFQAIHH